MLKYQQILAVAEKNEVVEAVEMAVALREKVEENDVAEEKVATVAVSTKNLDPARSLNLNFRESEDARASPTVKVPAEDEEGDNAMWVLEFLQVPLWFDGAKVC